MPFSSCTRDQEKLNDVINQVKALSNTVDELRAEVNAIKMSSFLRPDNNPIELLALQQFEKKDRGSRKSALSKFKRCFKKRKLLQSKPESYYYQEKQPDVFPPSSDRYYGENTQEVILSKRSPPVNGLNDQIDIDTAEVIRKRKNMVSSAPTEFSESQSTSESSSSSVDTMESSPSLRTWKFKDVGDAKEKNKWRGRKYLKRKKCRSKRETKKTNARFSTNDKYETSSSELAPSQLSDDDLSTEKDSLKYQRSVTFVDRRRELPKMTAQRSQTSSVSVISTEDPELDFDYGDRVKQSKNVWKVPMKSTLKNRIKRRSSNILRSRKKGKVKNVDCGTNCPYFKDFRHGNNTNHQVSIATDTVAGPRLTEHRKTQTESDVSNGLREEEFEKKASRQNGKVKSTRIAKVTSSKLESSSSDGQGINRKRKSCCPFKKGSATQGKYISSNSDSDGVEPSDSFGANSKFVTEKRPEVVSENSVSTSERSTDSVNSKKADFGKNEKYVKVNIKKLPEDMEKIREIKIQRGSIDGPTGYDSSQVAKNSSRRTLFKIGKKRTQTILPARKNLPDNSTGDILERTTKNFEKSLSNNMHIIYPRDLESRGDRRVHGKEIFPKNSKKQGITKIPSRKKKFDGSLETDVISLSNFISPSVKKGAATPVDSEERIYEIKKEEIEKSKKDPRNHYDSQKYPSRIYVQPYVYQASYVHRNERPFVKESLSLYSRKSSKYIYSQSALVDINTSGNSCYNSKNEPSENPFTDTLLFIENQPQAVLDSGLRMTEISNRLYNCLRRLDHIIA